ncbi:MAG TPA: C-type lectin domain-containing protein, partial [Minicystis sp.]|nr:C-type lectin domain-containing protein [Minicystis sp.]
AGEDAPARDARPDARDAGEDDAADAADAADASRCGDGVLDPGEACDDTSSFCVGCQVSCTGFDEFRAPGMYGHCYRAVHEKVTFEEARAACEADHATLAMTYDPGEEVFVHGGVKQIDAGYKSVWIGAELVDAGAWAWLDGTRLRKHDSGWAAGEPDGVDGANAAACIGLQLAKDAGYADDDCLGARDYLCEYAPPVPDADGGDGG